MSKHVSKLFAASLTMDEDTGSSLSSIVCAPDHLTEQYTHLNEVFVAHPTEFPQRGPPESDSDAMINALKALQRKIQQLESERTHAADRLKHLSRRTENMPLAKHTLLQHPPNGSPSLSQDQENLRTRLESIDARFNLQAKQLEQIRDRLVQTEVDGHERLSKCTENREQSPHQGIDEDQVKMRQLEDDQAKLFSVHTRTEQKLKDIESQLLEEQHLRKQILDNTARLQTTAEVNRAILKASKPPRKPKRKRKASQPPTHICTCGAKQAGLGALCRCKPVPGVHYRMDMRDVPFVVGTSTTPSHSIGANYQCVLSLMKSHSPLLCGAAAACDAKHSSRTKTNSKRKSSTSLTELNVLLNGLEEEFGQLTFEHQALAREIEEHRTSSHSSVSTTDLEAQLEQVVGYLEAKAGQISTVKKQIRDHKQTKKTHFKCQSATLTEKSSTNPGASDKKTSLKFLKKMKTLQNTLQSDDLQWN